MPLTSPPPDDGFRRQIIEYAGGYVLGALTTLIAFRVRLSKIDSRLAAHDKRFTDMENSHTVELTRLNVETKKRHEENKDALRLIERRTMFTLKLMADVARKFDVDKRVDDVVIEFLTTDSEE